MQMNLFQTGPAADSPSPRPLHKPSLSPPVPGAAKQEFQHWKRSLDWLSERFEDLHLWVLKRNLGILADPLTSDAERADILEWVQAEADPTMPIRPFTFHACLVLYDQRCDLEQTRCRIRALNQQVLQRRRELTL